ncbi:MAG: hypothetical protein ABL973_02780 [Micropepsaceae bacterium]
MSFFASSGSAQEQGFHPVLNGHRFPESDLFIFNNKKARPWCPRESIAPEILTVRAAFGELLDVKENVGGREPPGRNTGCHT